MSRFYHAEDIKQITSSYDINKDFYVPGALFKNIKYRNLRLEVKWAYISLLHLILSDPHYNEQGEALLDYDANRMSEPMSKLMNKEVDEAKVDQYLRELGEADMIDEGKLVNIG